MSLRFQITSVSLSGSGTHQPHLIGVEKKVKHWAIQKRPHRGWSSTKWKRDGEIQSVFGAGGIQYRDGMTWKMKITHIVWGASGHKGNWIIYEQHFWNSSENLWIRWCMSGGLILWQTSNALINGCYLHPLVYDGHLLWTPWGPIGNVQKSGSAQVAALEEKVADREKSGSLGLRQTATLTSLSVRTELGSQFVLGGSPQRKRLWIRVDLAAALPFLHTHVCLSKAPHPL